VNAVVSITPKRTGPRPSRIAHDLAERWPALRWPSVAACTAIITGGFVAAATRPLELERGSWVAALLVLVGGVAQGALGAGRVLLPTTAPNPTRVAAETGLWNLAVIGTILGSLTSFPGLTTISGMALLVDLVLVYGATRTLDPARRRLRLALQVVLAVVFVSVPIGMTLAWIRHS
jgi:hypothetical protein